MKKIDIIIGSLGRGGAERMSIYLASYFISRGLDCDIITFSKQKNEYELPDGIKRYIAYENSANSFEKIKKIRDRIKESSPDAVLIMCTPLCTYAVPALAGLNIPFAVSERNDPTHFAGNKLSIKIARTLMKEASGFVFQTNDAKAFYDKALHGKGTVIPNPLVNEYLPEVFSGKREKRIAAVGRLHMQKNHEMLIKAFAEVHKIYPEYYLDIYGEGSQKEKLKQLCYKLNIDNFVLFHGNVPDVLEKIRNSAMYVMTSDFEGMPNALIEAMAVGLPCISTDCPCGGPKDLIENGVNGILTKVGDINETIRAIKFFIGNPDTAEIFGRTAANVRKKLDSKIIGERWLIYLKKELFK